MKRDPVKCLEEIQVYTEELHREAHNPEHIQALQFVLHTAKTHINHQRDEGFIAGREQRKQHRTVQLVEQLLVDHRGDLHDLQQMVENALADIV